MSFLLITRIGCDSIVTVVAVWLLANAQPGFTIWKYGLFGQAVCILAVLTALGAVPFIDWLARNQPVMAVIAVVLAVAGVT